MALKLGSRRACHRAHRGRTGRRGHALYRHQPAGWDGAKDLRGSVLPPRTGREPYQGVEDASGRRSNVVLPGHGQTDAIVPACRRLLANVEPAQATAATVVVARGPIRYAAFAPDQDRCAGRGDEDPGATTSAAVHARLGDFWPGAVKDAEAGRLSDGADAPAAPRLYQPLTPTKQPNPPNRPEATGGTEGMTQQPPAVLARTASASTWPS